MTPVSSSSCSRMPPTSVATTAAPQHIASSTTVDRHSPKLGEAGGGLGTGELQASVQPELRRVFPVSVEQRAGLVDDPQLNARAALAYGGQGAQQIVQPFELLKLADEQQVAGRLSRFRSAVEYRSTDAIGNDRDTLRGEAPAAG